LAAGPFHGHKRSGIEASEGVVGNWWLQAMIGGAKVHYDGIVAFLKMDPKKITIPMLTIHSEDHQIVLYGASGLLTGKLLRNEAPRS
jgi:non-heme chloroperoxidase